VAAQADRTLASTAAPASSASDIASPFSPDDPSVLLIVKLLVDFRSPVFPL
jgi:hypothetical protein